MCAGSEVAGETGQQWQGQGLPQAAAPFITVGMDRQRGRAGPGSFSEGVQETGP